MKCGVSISTITRTISKFVEEGYITTFYSPNGRIIHLKNTPKLIEEIEDCDIVPTTTPPTHDDYTPNHPDYTPSSQGLPPLITTTTNNIDNNIVDNIDNNISNIIEQKIRKLTEEFIDEGFNEIEAKKLAEDAIKIFD